MKTLNKKHLKIINELLFKMRSNENLVSRSERKSDLSLEDETFFRYLFWNTRVLSIELYENYGISYFEEKYQKSLVSEKEYHIKTMKEERKNWEKAAQKVA